MKKRSGQFFWRVVFLALFGFALAACGGPTNSNAVLRLLISGLPSGTEAAVRVVFPDQTQQAISSSTDLILPAGTYLVTGAAVSSQQAGVDAFTSNVNGNNVVLTAGSTSTVNIAYQPIVTKISPLMRVANGTTTSTLTSLTLGGDGRTTLVFSSSNPQIAGLQVGDLLQLGISAAAPAGHYGRVFLVSGTTIVTEPVSLGEAIEEGAIILSKSIDSNAAGVILPKGLTRSVDPGCLNVKVPISVSGGNNVSLEGSVVIGGQLCMKLNIDFRVSFSKKLKPNVYFTIQNIITSKFEVTGSLTATFTKEVEVLALRFAPITVVVGVVPVILVPQISLSIGASGSVTAGVQFGLETSADMTGGFSYNGDNNSFSPISRKTTGFTPPYPSPTASMSFKVYASPEAALLVYGLAGPFARLTPFVRFDVNFLPSFNWQLFAGITLSAGIKAGFKLLSIEVNFELYTFEKEVLTSSTPPPIGVPIGSAPGVVAENAMVITPDNTVYVGAGSSVKALSNTVISAWTYNTTNPVLGLLRGGDGSIYVWDFGGIIYALNANGSERWKSTAFGSLEIRRLALSSAGVLVAAGGTSVRAFNASTGAAGWTNTPTPTDSIYGVGIDQAGAVWVNGSDKLYKYTSAGVLTSSIAAPSTPGNLAIDASGVVYVRTQARLWAVNPNVSFKWTNLSVANPNSATIVSGNSDQASSPAIGADGTIYVCTTAPDAGLSAINSNGTSKWNYRFAGLCKATPTIGSDGRIYIQTDTEVLAIEANGGLAWKRAVNTPPGDPPSMSFNSNKLLVVGTAQGLSLLSAQTTLANSMWVREGGNANSSGVAQ